MGKRLQEFQTIRQGFASGSGWDSREILQAPENL